MRRPSPGLPGRWLPVELALVALVALVAWIVAVDRMRGMDMGPGTALGTLGWYLGIWVTMMAAMMLPSALPALRLYARTAGRVTSTLGFATGYLAVWTLFGLAAYGLQQLLSGRLPWETSGRYVAGAAIVAAGLYELTPVKEICLLRCRSPMGFLMTKWREGPVGPAAMGVHHGLYCTGCCGALMVTLFALGVMSLFWMAIVALVVLGEKALPGGERLARAVALGLLALGAWVAAGGLVHPSV
jgi:predicted metal-binding membrane protein